MKYWFTLIACALGWWLSQYDFAYKHNRWQGDEVGSDDTYHVQPLVVRNDTLGANWETNPTGSGYSMLGVDEYTQDYAPLSLDSSSGALRVHVVSGGTQYVEDAEPYKPVGVYYGR